MFNDISEMKKTTIALHEQLLGAIQTLPDATSTRSEGSAVCTQSTSDTPK
jgi:hypothetical protein